MKIFSKITFIFNISFVIFILLAYVELNHKKIKSGDSIMPLPFVTGLFVTLGELAIFINLIFCVMMLALIILKKAVLIPRWIVIVNFILLLIQVYYFFI